MDDLEKLSNTLQSLPTSEKDVIYILLQIRKILEIDKYPKNYSVLNFYCNLALHVKIDRCPKEVIDMLQRVLKDTDYSDSIVNFINFHNQLSSFLKDYNLPNFYKYSEFKGSVFNKILSAIYSNAIIIISIPTTYKIKIDKNGGISFTTPM